VKSPRDANLDSMKRDSFTRRFVITTNRRCVYCTHDINNNRIKIVFLSLYDPYIPNSGFNTIENVNEIECIEDNQEVVRKIRS